SQRPAAREERTLPRPIRDDVDEDPTVPLKTTRAEGDRAGARAAHSGDAGDKTVNIPAPFSFVSPKPPLQNDDGDGEDDLDRTTPMATLPRPEPPSGEQQYPPLTFDGEDTASVT